MFMGDLVLFTCAYWHACVWLCYNNLFSNDISWIILGRSTGSSRYLCFFFFARYKISLERSNISPRFEGCARLPLFTWAWNTTLLRDSQIGSNETRVCLKPSDMSNDCSTVQQRRRRRKRLISFWKRCWRLRNTVIFITIHVIYFPSPVCSSEDSDSPVCIRQYGEICRQMTLFSGETRAGEIVGRIHMKRSWQVAAISESR